MRLRELRRLGTGAEQAINDELQISRAAFALDGDREALQRRLNREAAGWLRLLGFDRRYVECSVHSESPSYIAMASRTRRSMSVSSISSWLTRKRAISSTAS